MIRRFIKWIEKRNARKLELNFGNDYNPSHDNPLSRV